MYNAIHVREHRFTYICSLTQLAKKETSNYYIKNTTIFVVAEKNSCIKNSAFIPSLPITLPLFPDTILILNVTVHARPLDSV